MIAVLLALAMGLSVVLAWKTGAARADQSTMTVATPMVLCIAVGALALLATGSAVLLVITPASVGVGWIIVLSEIDRRAELARRANLPVVAELLARRLDFGSTVREALSDLSPGQLGDSGLDAVVAKVEAGESVADALSAHAGLVGAALLATEVSAGRGQSLARLADRLRSAALDGEAARSHAGQQLASAAVMAALPPIVTVLYGLSDDRAANFYLYTPTGAVVLATALSLSVLGWWWMRFITRPVGPE